jgi:acetyl-CoA acetyltransferase
MPMGATAEKLGAQYKITREESDAFAHRSQTLWRQGNHYFDPDYHH